MSDPDTPPPPWWSTPPPPQPTATPPPPNPPPPGPPTAAPAATAPAPGGPGLPHQEAQTQPVLGTPLPPEQVPPSGPEDDPRRDQTRVLYIIIGVLTLIVVALLANLILGGDDGEVDVVTPSPTVVATPDPALTPTPPPTPPAVTPDPAAPAPDPLPPTEPVDPVAPDPPVLPDPEVPGPPPDPPPPEEGLEEDAGVLTAADGRQVFPIDEAALPTFAGQGVVGQAVLVQEVVDGVGFWIGSTIANRMFVESADPVVAGQLDVQVGQRVDFTGSIQPNTGEVVVPDDQGGDQYRRQGVHVELD